MAHQSKPQLLPEPRGGSSDLLTEAGGQHRAWEHLWRQPVSSTCGCGAVVHWLVLTANLLVEVGGGLACSCRVLLAAWHCILAYFVFLQLPTYVAFHEALKACRHSNRRSVLPPYGLDEQPTAFIGSPVCHQYMIPPTLQSLNMHTASACLPAPGLC